MSQTTTNEFNTTLKFLLFFLIPVSHALCSINWSYETLEFNYQTSFNRLNWWRNVPGRYRACLVHPPLPLKYRSVKNGLGASPTSSTPQGITAWKTEKKSIRYFARNCRGWKLYYGYLSTENGDKRRMMGKIWWNIWKHSLVQNLQF